MDIKEVSKAIGLAVEDWPSKCYAIASAMVRKEIVDGRAVYGTYHGKVHPGCSVRPFIHRYLKMGFNRHGWILKADGSIVDPTRWVFENAEPYIYEGKNDHYDEGANALREAFRSPAPAYDPKSNHVKLRLPPATAKFVKEFLGAKKVMTDRQAHWIATANPSDLGEHAEPIFQAMKKADLSALIPIDNFRAVLGDDA